MDRREELYEVGWKENKRIIPILYIYVYIYIFFHTAQQNRLVVSKSKISLFQTRVRFLGHYICQGTAKL
jgi:hypothetical protein